MCGVEGRGESSLLWGQMVQRQDSVVVVGQLETCCTFLSPLAGWNSSFEDKKGNVLASGAWDIPREASSCKERASKRNRAKAEPAVDVRREVDGRGQVQTGGLVD